MNCKFCKRTLEEEDGEGEPVPKAFWETVLRVKNPETHWCLERVTTSAKRFRGKNRQISAVVYEINMLNQLGVLMKHSVTFYTEYEVAVVFMTISCEGGWNLSFDAQQFASLFSMGKFAVENCGRLGYRHGNNYIAHLRNKIYKECLECGGCGKPMAKFK